MASTMPGGGAARPVRLLLARQLALAILGAGVWQWTQAWKPPLPDDPGPVAGTMILPATIEGAYPAALARAQRWREEARLLSASQQIDWPLDQASEEAVEAIPSNGWLTYVFVAPVPGPFGEERAASVSVVVERTSGAVVFGEVVGWDTPPAGEAPALSTYPVTSTGAVLAAEDAGGTGYRRACPVHRHLTRVGLVAGQRGGPEWLVTYIGARKGDRNGLVIRVDAGTGKVTSFEDHSISCEDEARRPGAGPRL